MHHGAAVALLLLPASRANVEACPGPYAALAEIVGGERAPHTDQDRAGWVLDQLADLLAGLPLRALTTGPALTGEQVRFVASEAMASSNIPSNPAPVNSGSLEEVLAACLSSR
jgi:alcohol dehydrogenase class IV